MHGEINAFIEVKKRHPEATWSLLGVFFEELEKDFELFEALAGIEWNGEFKNPIAANRGIPADASYQLNRKNCFDTFGYKFGDIPKELAESWVKSGKSKWFHEGILVTVPWHAFHSWCTLAELKQAIELVGGHDDSSYRYLVSIMELTEQLGHECRLVFWFDN